MAVQFIIDSSSDILPQECEKLGIAQVLPLKVIFGNEEYTDGVTMSHEDFYKKLAKETGLALLDAGAITITRRDDPDLQCVEYRATITVVKEETA